MSKDDLSRDATNKLISILRAEGIADAEALELRDPVPGKVQLRFRFNNRKRLWVYEAETFDLMVPVEMAMRECRLSQAAA